MFYRDGFESADELANVLLHLGSCVRTTMSLPSWGVLCEMVKLSHLTFGERTPAVPTGGTLLRLAARGPRNGGAADTAHPAFEGPLDLRSFRVVAGRLWGDLGLV
jgi:hypothetical protein